MNDKQLKKLCSGISVSDVISYIDAHKKEYQKFLELEKKESEDEKNELHKTKQSKKTNDTISSQIL